MVEMPISKDSQATVDVGFAMTMVGSLATRGERLALIRVRVSGRDPGAIQNDALTVAGIDADDRIVAGVVFDLDDVDAAFGELDARYLAGEAAAHAGTWSVIAAVLVAHNRREIAAVTTDAVSLDHRRGAAFAPGEGFEYIRAGWDLGQNLNIYTEIAHRLNDRGAVFTWAGHGTSHEGFVAEWRGVTLMTVDGEMVSRMEVFDEGDLDAALAKFDQLSRPAPRLKNTASQVTERFLACFAAREWDAMPQILGDAFSYDDRRRVVGSGVRDGGDAHVADMRASADLWTADVTPAVMATRGERLVLAHLCFPGRDQGPKAFVTDVLGIVEINVDERMVAFVSFELDDFDAAIAELDARYIAGEATAHAGTWSLVAGAFVALNRRELPATTTDAVRIDHRRVASFAPGEGFEYIRAGWDLDQNLNLYIETAHRVDDRGAVFTWTGSGTSHEGFEAEWRGVNLMTVDGEMLDRSEVFDEEDLDSALARFDQLSRPAPRLDNAASRVGERYLAHIAACDWHAMAEILADNFSSDDRRRVVGAGVRHGRDAVILDMRAIADLALMKVTSTVMATRGERLVQMGAQYSGSRRPEGAFLTDVLCVLEIDADERVVAAVSFDVDDIEAAFEELDARYLAGEAAAHAQTWSVIARAFGALNRHELLPTTPDWVNIDHRPVQRVEADDLNALIRATWDVVPQGSVYIEAVHRLSDVGVVTTYVARGTSQEGFDAEWRAINISTVDGEMISRSEVFDETSLDAALASFDQLSQQAPRLENAASRVHAHLRACVVTRNWNVLTEILADDIAIDDRRRAVNSGIQYGRQAAIADMRGAIDLGLTNISLTVIATRGVRLELCRMSISGQDRPDAFRIEFLSVVEINADERIVARVAFDLDDIDAAFAELDARYLAGEAAAYRDAWSVIAAGYAALNRYEVPPSAPDYVNIDHRLRATFEAADLGENLRAAWDLTPELKGYIEVVHRLSGLGAVVTHAAHGTTHDGLDAEWRGIHFLTLDGGMVNRCEIFDEADIHAALAKFNQLSLPALRLKNAVAERISVHISARDWDALAQDFAEDYCLDDRRRVVNAGVMHGQDAGVETTRVAAELGLLTNTTSTIIASRGERLTLERFHASGADHESIQNEALNIVEIDADERIAAVIMFDVDDIDAAFAELDARYLAGEASDHAHTWSVIARIYAAFNRHELPATTPDSVTIDHWPRAIIDAADLAAAIRAIWDVTPDLNVCIEAVHRLSDLGAVVTHTA